MEYKVVYIVSECKEQTVEADSFDEALSKWTDQGVDGELFFIEEPDGTQTIF